MLTNTMTHAARGVTPRAASLSTRRPERGTARQLGIALLALAVQSVPAPSQTVGKQNFQPAIEPGAPAATLTINYKDGQLTIDANNAPLAGILRMVAEQTGAWIEFPPRANERVAGRKGPGSVFEVLDSLLRSTSFDYAMLGSPAHPSEPVRVIVRARPAVPQRVQSPPPGLANRGAETAMTNSEDVAGDPAVPSREALEQRLRTIQQDLLARVNARGQANAAPHPQATDQQPQ